MRKAKIIGVIVSIIGFSAAGIFLLKARIHLGRESPIQSPAVESATSILDRTGGANNLPIIFFNDWENVDSQTTMITQVSIEARDGEVYVEMFGSCSPIDCSFREAAPNPVTKYNPKTKTLSVKWVTSIAITTQELTVEPDGQLKVIHHEVFTDDS